MQKDIQKGEQDEPFPAEGTMCKWEAVAGSEICVRVVRAAEPVPGGR